MNNDGSNNSGTRSDSQPYFTPGVGNDSPNDNPSTENLNTDDNAWKNEEAHNLNKIGQQAIFSPEPITTENATESPNNTEQTTTISMPPGYSEPEPLPEEVASNDYPSAGIKLTREHITSANIAAIKNSEVALSQTGDVASFYDSIRNSIIDDGEGK